MFQKFDVTAVAIFAPRNVNLIRQKEFISIDNRRIYFSSCFAILFGAILGYL